MAVLKLENVGVDFPIYGGGSRSLKKAVMRAASGGRIGRDAEDRLTARVLTDVSLSFQDGDRVGLIGRNGAGKTTLLRVLAGVFEPTQGRITRHGRISPLFDAMLGMDMEATGYENIVLRGMLLGLSAQKARSHSEEIAEFTELGEYLDMPVRTYSSGMVLRLAFAISTCVDPEILLMDEWLSVGDAHFIKKAEVRMLALFQRSSIMVMASHSEQLIRDVCNKAVLLHQGQVLTVGEVGQVLEAYHALEVPGAA
ncbi:MAG: ABC transporter ATP-binding protein [Pseudomonadota bacterium]